MRDPECTFGQVLQKMWQHTGMGRGNTAVIVDMCPYDGSLPRALVDYKTSVGQADPEMHCVSVLWCGQPPERHAIAAFLTREIRNHMYEASSTGKYSVPGFSERAKDPEAFPHSQNCNIGMGSNCGTRLALPSESPHRRSRSRRTTKRNTKLLGLWRMIPCPSSRVSTMSGRTPR